MKKTKESLCDIWDAIKCTNIRIMRVLEGEEWEKWSESLFKEIIAENVSILGRELDIQVHEIILSSQCKTTFSKTHYNETVKNQR